jgi:hypothetical protein
VLDQAALQISREREASQPRTPLLRRPELLRNGFASLALALGFATLARRPGWPLTLLQELQSGWSRSRFGGSGRCVNGSRGDPPELDRAGVGRPERTASRENQGPAGSRHWSWGSDGLSPVRSESAVNLTAMANTDHLHHQHLIEHLVNDAVIPDTHPVDTGFSLKGNAAGRWWILGQQINGGTDALLITPLQLRQGAHSTAGQANLIAPSLRIRA